MFLLAVSKHEQTIVKLIVKDSNSVALGFLLVHICRAQAVSNWLRSVVAAAAAKYNKVTTHCLQELCHCSVDKSCDLHPPLNPFLSTLLISCYFPIANFFFQLLKSSIIKITSLDVSQNIDYDPDGKGTLYIFLLPRSVQCCKSPCT